MNGSQWSTRVAVIGGGGLMGHTLVLQALLGGADEVTLMSRHRESVDHGFALVTDGPFGLRRAVQRKKLTEEQVEDLLGRLRLTTDYAEAVAHSTVIIESVPEDIAVKQAVFTEIEKHCAPDALIASNTSSIMIGELAAHAAMPQRFIGTHWFYPAHVMKLVEVAVADHTSATSMERTQTLLKDWGKVPIVVADHPGFFMTRFINGFVAEAIRLVEQGVARVEDIDTMTKLGLGWPMGLFELMDSTGSFDAWFHAQQYLQETLGDRYAVPPLARKVFLSGFLGNPALKPQSKGGWHDYFHQSVSMTRKEGDQ
ncbi:MAG: 3-hydroxyacyl-CoA dehydrogenase [Sulfobacillus benefaciens]|uniref:3-hydroxyacyl-CoA dehydrogenase n=1 Tax=Sulfobacillus benefaciens TaxID=453960 RepID=A0A2T2XC43_9FIRM|nr:MAG: 3-hydroxyacyl-CoA dehydrogenase [Sulfobacillus benefaciens]